MLFIILRDRLGVSLCRDATSIKDLGDLSQFTATSARMGLDGMGMALGMPTSALPLSDHGPANHHTDLTALAMHQGCRYYKRRES